MSATPNGYELSKRWWDWSFRNPGEFSPTHGTLYAWFVEAWNRSGWQDQFEMAPQYAMSAIGCRAYNTYRDTLSDLEQWGFIKVVQKGSNQYYPWILAVSKIDEAIVNPWEVRRAMGGIITETKVTRSRQKTTSAVLKINNPPDSAPDTPPDKAVEEPVDNPSDAFTINRKLETENLKPETEKGGTPDLASLDSVEEKKSESVFKNRPAPGTIPPSVAPLPEYPGKDDDDPFADPPKAPARPAKAKSTPKPPEPPIEFPDTWTAAMVTMYRDEWMPTYQIRARKKMDPPGLKAQIKAMSVLAEPEFIACIEKSIANGWKGLFPDKFPANGKSKNAQPSQRSGPKIPLRDRAGSAGGPQPESGFNRVVTRNQ